MRGGARIAARCAIFRSATSDRAAGRDMMLKGTSSRSMLRATEPDGQSRRADKFELSKR